MRAVCASIILAGLAVIGVVGSHSATENPSHVTILSPATTLRSPSCSPDYSVCAPPDEWVPGHLVGG